MYNRCLEIKSPPTIKYAIFKMIFFLSCLVHVQVSLSLTLDLTKIGSCFEDVEPLVPKSSFGFC